MSEELSLAEESSDYPDFNFTLCQLPELEHVIGETITTITSVVLLNTTLFRATELLPKNAAL